VSRAVRARVVPRDELPRRAQQERVVRAIHQREFEVRNGRAGIAVGGVAVRGDTAGRRIAGAPVNQPAGLGVGQFRHPEVDHPTDVCLIELDGADGSGGNAMRVRRERRRRIGRRPHRLEHRVHHRHGGRRRGPRRLAQGEPVEQKDGQQNVSAGFHGNHS
jgi:hypothetical protein